MTFAAIPPAEVWPVSVTGWLTAIGVVVSLGMSVWTKAHATHIAARASQRREDETDAKIAEGRVETNNFRAAVDTQMNGFGRRIDKVEEDSKRFLQESAAAERDREYTASALERIEKGLDACRQSSDRLVEAIAQRKSL